MCEFEKYERKSWLERINTDNQQYRRIWRSELKNHQDDIVLFIDDKIIIDVSLGSADYYMGDINTNTTYPSFRVFEKKLDDKKLVKFIHDTEELKEYGIEICHCLFDSPALGGDSLNSMGMP